MEYTLENYFLKGGRCLYLCSCSARCIVENREIKLKQPRDKVTHISQEQPVFLLHHLRAGRVSSTLQSFWRSVKTDPSFMLTPRCHGTSHAFPILRPAHGWLSPVGGDGGVEGQHFQSPVGATRNYVQRYEMGRGLEVPTLQFSGPGSVNSSCCLQQVCHHL